MKFSIIIPVFNAATRIQTTIESCLKQSFSDFEIIVVDDGSADESLNILHQLQNKHSQIKVLHLEENLGPSSARNKAWGMATGDYVAFLDDDDYWHPQKLERIDLFFSQYPDAVCVGHAHDLFQGEMIFKKYESKLLPVRKLSSFDFLIKNHMVTPSVVVRRDIKERFDEKMSYCEDHDLWLRLSQKHPVYFMSETLVYLARPVLSAGGLSAHRRKMRLGEFKLYFRFAKRTVWGFLLLPFFWLYSGLKHLRSSFLKGRVWS